MTDKKLQIPIKETYASPGIILNNKKYLRNRDIRDRFNIKQYTVRRWVAAGKLPRPSDGGLYDEVDVIEYMTRVS